MLYYIYTDRVEDSKTRNCIGEIFAAWNMYQLNGLTAVCSDFISRNLNCENAMEFLIQNLQHDCHTLLEIIRDYVVMNIAKIAGSDCTTEEYKYVMSVIAKK